MSTCSASTPILDYNYNSLKPWAGATGQLTSAPTCFWYSNIKKKDFKTNQRVVNILLCVFTAALLLLLLAKINSLPFHWITPNLLSIHWNYSEKWGLTSDCFVIQ